MKVLDTFGIYVRFSFSFAADDESALFAYNYGFSHGLEGNVCCGRSFLNLEDVTKSSDGSCKAYICYSRH